MSDVIVEVDFRSERDGCLYALVRPATKTAFFGGKMWKIVSARHPASCEDFADVDSNLATFPWKNLVRVWVGGMSGHVWADLGHCNGWVKFAPPEEDDLADVIKESLEFSAILVEKREKRLLALMMASHPRLGAESCLGQNSIPCEVLEMIVRHKLA